MNLEPELKQSIDAYIAEVGIHLPRKKRQDIAVEIRSLILDALEDQAQDGQLDQGRVMAVLRQLGSPADMAARYTAHNYVIGPKLYAPFVVTVRGVLFFMAIFFLLGFAFSWDQVTASPAAFGNALWGLTMAFLKNAFINFSVIVLVFIILERILPDQDWFEQTKVWGALSGIPFFRQVFGYSSAAPAWDPAELTATPKSEPVKKSESILILALIILLAILFNFFPHLVGVYGFIHGEPFRTPLLALTFRVYLPWWNLYWVLTLGLHFALLARGRWTRLTRWVEVSLMVFSGILVYWMLKGPAVIGIASEFLALGPLGVAAENLIPIMTTIFEVTLVLHLIIKVPVLFLKVFNLLGRPPVLIWKPKA